MMVVREVDSARHEPSRLPDAGAGCQTPGLAKPIWEAVEGAFRMDVDYAMLVRIYGVDPQTDRRLPPTCVSWLRTSRRSQAIGILAPLG